MKHLELVTSIIKPETSLERSIIANSEFLDGVMWGKPRNGHPEGKVIYHIGDVLANIDKFITEVNREDLRLIAIIHDSFKRYVDENQPRHGDNHHAMIARKFAAKYISNTVLLEIIELHDEAYNAWCVGSRDGKWTKAEARATRLIVRLGDWVHLYLAFYKCDNTQQGKANDCYDWFEKLVYDYYH
jgi:hypothetical protein